MSAEIRSYLVAIISVKQESAGVFKFLPNKKQKNERQIHIHGFSWWAGGRGIWRWMSVNTAAHTESQPLPTHLSQCDSCVMIWGAWTAVCLDLQRRRGAELSERRRKNWGGWGGQDRRGRFPFSSRRHTLHPARRCEELTNTASRGDKGKVKVGNLNRWRRFAELALEKKKSACKTPQRKPSWRD